MPDIATLWDAANTRGDWAIARPATAAPSGLVGFARGLVFGGDLETAVLISVFTDALAGADDEIPDGSTNRRGWWGDPTIGSKIWLRRRQKQTTPVLAIVKQDLQSCLQWLIDDGVAAKVDVLTEWTRPAMLGAKITIHRTDGAAPQTFAYAFAWEGIG